MTATNFLWGGIGSVQTLLSSELNNLATGSGSSYGSEYNNTNGPQLATLWFHVDTNSITFTTNSYVKVFFVPSTTPGAASGTYPSYTSGSSYKLSESNYLSAVIYINPSAFSSAVTDETIANVIIPAGYWKPILVNATGSSLPNTNNNTLKIYTTPTQY